jgi:hypothetical protein
MDYGEDGDGTGTTDGTLLVNVLRDQVLGLDVGRPAGPKAEAGHGQATAQPAPLDDVQKVCPTLVSCIGVLHRVSCNRCPAS